MPPFIVLSTVLLAACQADGTAQDAERFETIELQSVSGETHPYLIDINGDGRLDFIEARQTPGQLAVRLGIGAGGFGETSLIESEFDPNWVRAGDFNADGIIDLVVPNHETNFISWFPGDGEGGFGPRRQIDLPDGYGPHPHVVLVEDVNRDGSDDLVVDDRDERSVYIFYADENGWRPQRVDVGGDPYLAFAVADFNGDGRPDFASPNEDHVAIVLQDHAGEFSIDRRIDAPRPFALMAEDVDGDGGTELVIASEHGGNNLTLLDDDLTTVLQQWQRPPGPKQLAMGDVDGDGTKDLLVLQWNGIVWLASGEPGQMTDEIIEIEGLSAPWGAAMGDVDRDGRAEIIVTDGESDSAIVLQLSD